MGPHQVPSHHSGFEHQRLALLAFGLPTDRAVVQDGGVWLWALTSHLQASFALLCPAPLIGPFLML